MSTKLCDMKCEVCSMRWRVQKCRLGAVDIIPFAFLWTCWLTIYSKAFSQLHDMKCEVCTMIRVQKCHLGATAVALFTFLWKGFLTIHSKAFLNIFTSHAHNCMTWSGIQVWACNAPHSMEVRYYVWIRSIGARWAPTSSLRPFGPAWLRPLS